MRILPPSSDEALDRALSVARTPSVPADLAARIVARVTELPQPAPGATAIPQAGRALSGRHRALAAALGAVVIVGAVALSGLWSAGIPATSDRPSLVASSGKPAEPRLAAGSGDELARSDPETELRAPAREIEEIDGTANSTAPVQPAGPTSQSPAPAGESGMPIVPDEGAARHAEVELAERAPEPAGDAAHSPVEVAAGPAGPAVSSGSDPSSSTATNTVPGLPPPQGLGIAGNPSAPPAPGIKSGPVGRRPPPSRR